MILLARGIAPDWLDVSRETLVKLDGLLALVEKWNPAINLVAPGSLPDAWQRHVIDSAQLFPFIPPLARELADFGSGAGFPGLVLAILAQASLPNLHVTLVESDRRKATFLSQSSQQLDLSITVLTERAEVLPPLSADVVTARALAPLVTLCGIADRHLKGGGIAIFPKGTQWEKELAEAATHWRFDHQHKQSQTDPTARILTVKGIRHA
jgi:16S rRNA (guanine527-N7)-methyltransferase